MLASLNMPIFLWRWLNAALWLIPHCILQLLYGLLPELFLYPDQVNLEFPTLWDANHIQSCSITQQWEHKAASINVRFKWWYVTFLKVESTYKISCSISTWSLPGLLVTLYGRWNTETGSPFKLHWLSVLLATQAVVYFQTQDKCFQQQIHLSWLQ